MKTYTFTMSSASTDFSTTYSPTIMLERNKKYEAALISLDTYHSVPNITSDDHNPTTIENNIFKYSTDNGETWKIIALNTGSYELSSINNEIQRQMIENNDFDSKNNEFYITILANISELKSIVNITNQSYKVDFSAESSIGPTLGFGPSIIEHGYNLSPNIVDIMKINSILVNIDIIHGSYVNGSNSPTIYSFYPTVSPGLKITERPKNLIYYPITKYDIRTMRVWLTDQDGGPINLRGERLSITISLREIVNMKRYLKIVIKELKQEKII